MKLQQLLSAYCQQNKVTFRKLAKEIGVDHTALFKFIKGHHGEGRSLARIITWVLGL